MSGALKGAEREQKAQRLLDDAIDAVEGYANRYEHDDVRDRARIAGLLSAVAMAAVVKELGWFRASRVVIGSVIVAFRYKLPIEV